MSETEKLLSALAERERLLRQERTETEHATTLLRALDVLHASGVPDEGIEQVLDICAQAAGADIAVFLRRCDDGGMETRQASWPEFGTPHWGIDARTFASGRRVTNLNETAFRDGLPAEARGFRSLLSVPVVVDGEPAMALVLLATSEAHFSRFDMALMWRMAAVLKQAFEKFRLMHRNAVLAGIVDRTVNLPEAPGFLDASFAALSRAFARVADWQGQVVDITNDLLSARSAVMGPAIEHALARTGQLAGSDRTYVFRLRPPGRIDNTHEWVAPGIEPMIEHLQDMPDDILDEWRSDLEARRPVDIPDVGALPADSAVREVLEMQGIRSLLAVPMLRDGALTGFVGYDAVRAHRSFLPVEIQLLQSVANAIGVVLDRTAAQTRADEAHALLLQERDRLDATLAAIPDLLLELDADGRFTGYAAGTQVAPAMAPETMIGRTPEEVLPPDLARLARSVLREVDQHGYCSGHEYEMQISGERRWFQITASAKNRNGSRDGYVFLIHDNTDAHRQQQLIRRLGRIAALTSNLVIVTDVEGRIDWVNPAFEQRSGWKLDEVRGRKPGDFLQSERTDRATVARISTALANGAPVRAELLNVARSGEEYWISKDIQPLTDAAGKLDGFVSVQTDITALKKSYQRALRLRVLAMDASTDGIALSTPEGYYAYMNLAHRRLFGISEQEDIRQLRWQDLVTPEATSQLMIAEWDRFKATGTWQGELTGWHRDGRALDLDVALTRTEDGGLLCIARDISSRRHMELEQTRLREELQVAQRRETVAQLASGVAHDLNNLVAVVSGTVALLDMQCVGDESVSVGLSRIGRAMDAAGVLVAGLGQLGKRDAPRDEHDLRLLIREGIDLLGTARIQQHVVRAELPETARPVWANRTDILQVIVNLALNACEADADRHPRVTLAVAPAGAPVPGRAPDIGDIIESRAYSTFSVTDTGPGVDPAIRERLFERYATTKGQSGTGLGLPIVAGIVRDNDAALWFDSVADQGTTVTVAWPADRGTEFGCNGTGSGSGRHGNLVEHRILVVDDVVNVADVLTEMLETDGAVAIAVADPAEALSLMNENPGLWSTLVTDLDMPGISGADLALAASRLEPPIPCVLVTALPESSGWDRRLFHAVLSKPVQARPLIESVRAAVSSRARRSITEDS